MLKPKISVVMAVYNGGELLNKTITSILHQTFEDYEFIIVDDCSTDATRQVVSSFGDSRIVLVCNETNIGQTKSLNIGLRVAKGKYIARIDAGDVSLPDRLQKQVEYMENHPDTIVLGTSAFRYNEHGRILDVVHMPKSMSAIQQRIFFASPLVHISVLMRRKTINDLGGYDEDYHVLADFELWSRLIRNGYRLTSINDVLAGYMVSAQSFGNIHAAGKSVTEAVRIIKSNADHFTNQSLSLGQARNVYKMLTFHMAEMSLEEIKDTEKLFIQLLKNIRDSNNNAEYHIARKNLIYLIKNRRSITDRRVFNYILKSVLLKSISLLTPLRLVEIMNRFIDSLTWRRKKSVDVVVVENFSAPANWI